MRFKRNDKAIIIEGPDTTNSGHEFKVGTEVNIERVDARAQHYLAMDDTGESWYVKDRDLGEFDPSRIDIIGQNGNDGSHYELHVEQIDPSHYQNGAIECIDCIRSALTEEEFRGFCKGNIIKYTYRERHKGGAIDVGKAIWYADQLTRDEL